MLKEVVYYSIKTRIIVQQLKPGERLNEKALMEEYGIGKTPLREVFFNLQHDGLIRRFPRSGTIVAPIDFTELREAAEIRLVLEELAGELATRHITSDILEDLRVKTEELEEASKEGVHEKFIITEAALHGLIYTASRNEKLRRIVMEQQSLFSRLWFSAKHSGLDLRSQVEDWKNIHTALHERDSKSVMRINKEHFQTFYTYLKRHL